MASQSSVSPGCERDSLFHTLGHLSIRTTTKVYDPDRQLDKDQDGTYCKNLLLKDRKGQFYLVIIPSRKTVDLKLLKLKLKAHRNLNFAAACDLMQLFHVVAGGLTPFGVVLGDATKVRIILDQSLAGCSGLYFHPFEPREATCISVRDLDKFISHCNNDLEMIDLCEIQNSEHSEHRGVIP